VRLDELAGKASLLPWANTDTAKELLNVEPDDWWKIYALNGPEEKRFPYHVVCSMSQRATEEEMTAARKACFNPDGDHIMRDPGKSGDNARYIAAACNAVPALVAEVRRLRRNYECREKSLQRHEHRVAELMEKVEWWEWLEEVRTYDIDAFHPYREHKYANPYEDKKAKSYGNAYLEWAEMLHAAREAVHADRE